MFGSGNPPTPISPGNPTPGTRELADLIVQAYATDFNDRLFDNRKPHPNQLWEAFDVPVPPDFTKSPNTDPCPEMSSFTFYEDDHAKVSATLVNHAPVFPALAQEGLYQHLIQAHTLIEDVGPIAQEAGVKTLVLSHLVPGNRPDNVWEACGKGFDGQLIFGHDLDVIGVGTAT